jgi:hypothetical protein
MIEDVVVETETERELRGQLAEAQDKIEKLEIEVQDLKYGDDAAHCWYCGTEETIEATFHWEHQTPRVRGGTNQDTNIVRACRACNLAKGAMTAQEFRDRFERLHGTRLFYAEREGLAPCPDAASSWHEVFIEDQLWLYAKVIAGSKGWPVSRIVQWALFDLLEKLIAKEDRRAGGPV